ncbi:uncharacterized protein SPPG_05014 [Spizellomyces punctatus DAOM BR117]|uniref:C2H2-type domain-containing protein n=1 Tax=Spizellomyces punctatus (strain DAOM BR117) TaxID=645134 RepID=A0A0L0HFS6_SPIPD|nr:uncharacterized protein SPPG_05014 [Spizellomyces punctatus DAOM BR117]KNC99628.1 hypothetical protein SPPG_05014 [Spizellomyces punctatus DAOM BR117]|eukprot:XP_016607668.1 hypothetical protein SPPG_05014 [Spizellomyces punctatus DAOM BR117]
MSRATPSILAALHSTVPCKRPLMMLDELGLEDRKGYEEPTAKRVRSEDKAPVTTVTKRVDVETCTDAPEGIDATRTLSTGETKKTCIKVEEVGRLDPEAHHFDCQKGEMSIATVAADTQREDVSNDDGEQSAEIVISEVTHGKAQILPEGLDPAEYHDPTVSQSQPRDPSIAGHVAFAAANELYLPPFLRSIYGDGPSLHQPPQNHNPRPSPQNSRPFDVQSLTTPVCHNTSRPGKLRKGSQTSESLWWQRKQFVCDFKTTNVELYRWHTTHLKVTEQKVMAEARAAAAYATTTKIWKPNTTHPATFTCIQASSSTASQSTLPTLAPRPTDSPCRPQFFPDPETDVELGLLRDAVSGRLVMTCPAAFAVKGRLERHKNGKNPAQWTGGARESDYVFTAATGNPIGRLGEENAWEEDGPVAVSVKGKGKGRGRAKARKPFSFERMMYVCSWPVCGREFTKRGELQEHVVNIHQIPVPTAVEKQPWIFSPKFSMVPLQNGDSLNWISSAAVAASTRSVSEILEWFRKGVWNVMAWKLGKMIELSGLRAGAQDNPVNLTTGMEDGPIATGYVRTVDMDCRLNEFVRELDMQLVEGEMICWVAGSNLQVDSIIRSEMSTVSPNRKLRDHARALAAGTRPTPVVTAFEIDPTQIPFPTVAELLKEFGQILVASLVEYGLLQTIDQGSRPSSLAVDMDRFQAVVEQWSAEQLVRKAVKFVLEAQETEARRLGLATVGSIPIDKASVGGESRSTPKRTVHRSTPAPKSRGKTSVDMQSHCRSTSAIKPRDKASVDLQSPHGSTPAIKSKDKSTVDMQGPPSRILSPAETNTAAVEANTPKGRSRRNADDQLSGKENRLMAQRATPPKVKPRRPRATAETVTRVIAAAAREREKAALAAAAAMTATDALPSKPASPVQHDELQSSDLCPYSEAATPCTESLLSSSSAFQYSPELFLHFTTDVTHLHPPTAIQYDPDDGLPANALPPTPGTTPSVGRTHTPSVKEFNTPIEFKGTIALRTPGTTPVAGRGRKCEDAQKDGMFTWKWK